MADADAERAANLARWRLRAILVGLGVAGIFFQFSVASGLVLARANSQRVWLCVDCGGGDRWNGRDFL